MDAPYKHHPVIKVIRIFLLFIISSTVIAGSILAVRAANPEIVSPVPEKMEKASKPFTNLFKPKKDPAELKKIIQSTIGNTWPNYSVAVVDLKGDFVMNINDAQIFTAASVNKIPILAGIYYYVQQGSIKLEDTVSLQEQDIQDYGTGSIRYDPPGTSYSIKTLARLMMQKSDNTAAYILANYTIGLPKLKSLLTSWGMDQTDMDNNKTSNKDMAALMKKMVNGNIANVAWTQEMLSFMKDSDFEDRLPKNLPPDTPVYHKIGTQVAAVHDVGVVVGPTSTYYIGIFTENVPDEEQAAELVSNLSKKVYDFML